MYSFLGSPWSWSSAFFTLNAQGLPNLVPYQPDGWSAPIVVSNLPGTNTDSSPLLSTDTLFIDVAVANAGDVDTYFSYTVALWLDDELVQSWTIEPPHEAWDYYFDEDVTFGPLSPGTYTLELDVDYYDDIYESNEYDNVYTKTIVISGQQASAPNLKPYQPSGWDSAMVVSTDQNSHSDAQTISSADSIFIDWAVLNDGEKDVSQSYNVSLLVDGTQKDHWSVNPPHEVNYFIFVEDYALGSLSVGNHKLELVIDSGGAVTESNEADNRFTRQIQVVDPPSEGTILLIFPRVQSDQFKGTGLAIANPTGSPADVTMLLLDQAGNARSGAGITNPAVITIPPGGQLARTVPELFGASFASSSDWVLASSDNLGLVGFFLSYTSDISGIDGAEAISLLGTSSLVFPEILCGSGEFTEITVIGSGDVDAELHSAAEGLLASRVLHLPADQPGSRVFTVNQLFGRQAPCGSYVRVSGRTSAVYGYETFGSGTAISGRNGIPVRSTALSGTQSLFGAQLADNAAIRTTVTIINPTDSAAELTLKAYATGVSNGTPAATRQLVLESGGIVHEDARSLLQLPAGDFVGWLRVDSDVLGIVGDLSFGDPNNAFLSSVQLQHVPITDAVFSHVADGLGYLTGLTFLNTARDAAHVTLQVFGKTGQQTGSTQFNLQPFEHRPRLLTELVEGLDPQVGGFIRVKSDVGILTFELFSYLAGGKLQSLAAVPPQRGKGLISGRLAPSAVGAAAIQSQDPLDRFPFSRSRGIRLSVDDEFVVGDAIVRLQDASLVSSIQDIVPAGTRPAVVTGGDATVLIRSAVVAGSTSPAGMAGEGAQAPRLATLDYIEYLNSRPEVLYAVPNYIRHVDAVPNDTHYHYQWHYSQIHLPEVWDVTKGSQNVVVAIVDTGARFDHPDLGGRLTAGQFDFISDPQVAADGDGIDPSAQDPGDDPGGTKSSFHGTHVAGTIGAVTNNGLGVAGVNWVSPLMTLRVLGVGGGQDWDIMQALKFAARLPNSSGKLPARKANVINMSLGGAAYNPAFQETVNALLAENVVIVAAAGNSNTDTPHYPAGYDGVISVGAIDLSGSKAPYSNYGPRIDVVAPGGNVEADLNGDSKADGVLSTIWNSETNQPSYVFYQGTSMASPHVAGVVSLMLSVNPSLTPAQVRSILQQTAVDLGTTGKDDTYGYGLINPVAAVRAAGGTGPTQPKLLLSQTSLDFGTAESQLTVTVSNGGGGQLTVNSPTMEVDSGQDWLTARLNDRTVVVQVRRDGLSNGTYSGRVRVSSNGGNGTIEVRMVVGAQPDPQTGTLYVLALDPVNLDSISGAEANEQGQYRYVLPAMDIGTCLVAAGSDDDGDGYICEEGEFCGFYPVFGDSVNVGVTANQTTRNIDFAVSRRIPASQDLAGPWKKRGFAIPIINHAGSLEDFITGIGNR